MTRQRGKHQYKHTLIAVFLIVFSVALTLLMLVYFVALTARQKSDQREMMLADTSSRFDIMNTELLTVFNSFSHVQKSAALQALAESHTPQEMYFNAIGAQQQIAENTLAASRLNYYSIAAVYLEHGQDLVVTPTESVSLATFAGRIGTTQEELQGIYDTLSRQPYGHNLLFSGEQDADGRINYITLHHYNNGSLLFVLSIDRENFEEAFASLKCSDWMICTSEIVLAAKNEDPARYAPMIEVIGKQAPETSGTLAPMDFSLNGENVMGASFSEIKSAGCFLLPIPLRS